MILKSRCLKEPFYPREKECTNPKGRFLRASKKNSQQVSYQIYDSRLSVCSQEIKAEYEAVFKITELIHLKKRAITSSPNWWLYLLSQVVMVAGNSCQRVSALNRCGSMLRLQVKEFLRRLMQVTNATVYSIKSHSFLFLLWNFNQSAKINLFTTYVGFKKWVGLKPAFKGNVTTMKIFFNLANISYCNRPIKIFGGF